MIQYNTIQLKERFNQYTAAGTVQSDNTRVDKWFNETMCSSKVVKSTKNNLLNIARQSRHMTYNLNHRVYLNAQLS